MPSIKQLEEQGRALVAQQKSLVEDESRPWSDKKSEFDKMDADIKAVLEQHAALKSVDGSPFDAVADAQPIERNERKSLGQAFIESAAYKDALGKGGGQFSTGGVELKANLTEAAGGAGSVVPYYVPTVTEMLFRRLTVAQLMPNGSISSPTLIYPKESSVTNAAATVAEGGLKPQSDLNIVQVTEKLSKIANAIKISDEMLEDVSYVQSYVDSRLTLFVQLAEEDQLLNGSGTGTNLTGLMNRAGLQTAVAVPGTPAQTDRVDSIYKQITAIRANSFLEPDGIVIHPTDWQTIRLNKDANNQYFGGGPFTGAYGVGSFQANPTALGGGGLDLWGCRVVVTPAIAVGTALVGAFGTAAGVYRKGGIRVESTNSNEADFLNNLVAVRAEERVGMAVYRPGAFGKVTGL
jgi:HK97 family phage major capsid protein